MSYRKKKNKNGDPQFLYTPIQKWYVLIIRKFDGILTFRTQPLEHPLKQNLKEITIVQITAPNLLYIRSVSKKLILEISMTESGL